MLNNDPKPFVKWAGGKSSLIKVLEANLPRDFDKMQKVTYIEPFVGGGAMLFHMLKYHPNISRVVINDINKDLIQCYSLIKNNPKLLIDCLKLLRREYKEIIGLENKEKFYYAKRDEYNKGQLSPVERAAYLIFLNRTCYNGLYRVNLKGEFNVPFGDRDQEILFEETILADHQYLSKVEIKCGDYKNVIRNLGKGYNFVYLDPPYRPISSSSNFKKYSEFEFGDQQQIDLKRFCDRLNQRGCYFMQSNSDSQNADGTSFFQYLYAGYGFQVIEAARYINTFSASKNKESEILITNYVHNELRV